MTFDELELLVNKLPQPIAKLLNSSFFRYVIGGCIAASVHLSVVAIAVEFGNMDKENANSLGFAIGIFINYFFQRRFTFRQHARSHTEQIPLFIGFALLGLGINRFVYSHGMHDFHLQYMIAAAMAILVVFIFNFTVNSLITFRPRGSSVRKKTSAQFKSSTSAPSVTEHQVSSKRHTEP